MNRQQAIIASALVMSLASAGTTAWSLRQQAGLQTRMDQMSAQVDSAVSDAAQARQTAAEGEIATVALRQSLGREISRISAELDEISPSPLSNRPSLDDDASDVARVSNEVATTRQDVSSLRISVSSLESEYREMCRTLQSHSDLILRC